MALRTILATILYTVITFARFTNFLLTTQDFTDSVAELTAVVSHKVVLSTLVVSLVACFDNVPGILNVRKMM